MLYSLLLSHKTVTLLPRVSSDTLQCKSHWTGTTPTHSLSTKSTVACNSPNKQKGLLSSASLTTSLTFCCIFQDVTDGFHFSSQPLPTKRAHNNICVFQLFIRNNCLLTVTQYSSMLAFLLGECRACVSSVIWRVSRERASARCYIRVVPYTQQHFCNKFSSSGHNMQIQQEICASVWLPL